MALGAREDALVELLRERGHAVGSHPIPRPTQADFASSKLADEVRRVYRALGGRLPAFPARVGPWDTTVDGIAIELDEERHFNRYRRETLDCDLYERLPAFPRVVYRELCVSHEPHCVRAAAFGGYWSNKSCDAQFGPSSSPGELDGAGSSRWKQRAFYDFLKDLAPILIGVPVARISVWDSLSVSSRMSVGDVLARKPRNGGTALWSLIQERARDGG